MRRRVETLLAIAMLSVAWAVLTPQAGAAYVEAGSFAGGGTGPGGSGSEPGQLSNPGQADVGPNGKLYVADTGNNRVQVFAPTATGGTFESEVAIAGPTGLAINQADGTVYVATAGGVSAFDASLNPVSGGVVGPTGPLAVDPSTADLLIADTAANLIRRYGPGGVVNGSFAATRPIDLAVNSSGQIFVVTSTGDLTGSCGPTSAVEKFSAAGVSEGTIGTLTAPGAIAVDPDDDSVVVAAHVNEYFCEAGNDPELAFFDSDGTFTEAVSLSGALYAMVPGLAAAGGSSSRVYAVTKSPMNDSFGATKAVALEVPSPPTAPSIVSQSAQPRTTEATLRATIDPGNSAIKYRFEYGPTAGYGQSTAENSIPLGNQDRQVAVDVAGLTPGMAYHYRVVASNEVGTATGTDGVFTTSVGAASGDGCANAAARSAQGATFLADCRAYERVTPQAKNGNDIFPGIAQAAAAGGGIAFTAAGAFGNAQAATADARYVAFRGADGWQTKGVMPTIQNNATTVDTAYQFSADLRQAVVSAGSAADPAATPNTANFFRRDNTTDQFKLLSPRPNGTQGYVFDGIGSADLSHYMFTTERPFIEGDPQPNNNSVYEGYVEDGISKLRLIAVEASVGSGAIRETAMSEDGGRAYYTSPGKNTTFVPYGQLYLREAEKVVEVSASQLETPEAQHRAAFFYQASPDGSKVLFGSPERLVEESNADGGELVFNDVGDLYLYDVDSGALTAISAAAPSGGRLLGVLGVSRDLGRVYFADRAVLAAGATDGAPNLYRWDAGAGVSFIATLDDEDGMAWEPQVRWRQAKVSADGSGVVFQSKASLDGFDPGGRFGIYYYRAEDGSLACISCQAGGAQESDARLTEPLLGNMPAYHPRFVSDDGDRAFFTSGDRLLARDVNGKLDAYAWDGRSGTLSLLSTGQGDFDSSFIDASASGDDAFFVTRAQLVASDTDSLVDAYDARVGGGLPEPPPPTPGCVDEACKPPPTPAPTATPPASSVMAGPGSSTKRARCAKPARKRSGKSGSKAKARGARASASGKAKAGKKVGKRPSKRNSCKGGRS